MVESEETRMERTRRFYSISAIFFVLLFVYLIWALQVIILPIIIGLISAYLCLPVLNALNRSGLSRSFSVLILVFGFFLTILIAVYFGYKIIPDEDELIELRLGLQYNIQNNYVRLMGLDESESGNVVYTVFGGEMNTMIRDVTCFLSLSDSEKKRLRMLQENQSLESEKLPFYLRNLDSNRCEDEEDKAEKINSYLGSAVTGSDEDQPTFISSFFNLLSIWIIMPFVFISTLLDDGRTRRRFIQLIPNAYFEMALTTLNNVDKAIGTYLRCMFSNILIVGIIFIVSLKIIGFGYTSSVVIGILSGVLNAIPLIGSLIALVIIVLYSLLILDPSTILPFINQNNIILWSVIVFLIIQIIDNTIFKPFLMGNAINLNPVVIIITAVGGAIIAGFIGMILAIPVVLIIKVGFTTLREELKRYFFIY